MIIEMIDQHFLNLPFRVRVTTGIEVVVNVRVWSIWLGLGGLGLEPRSWSVTISLHVIFSKAAHGAGICMKVSSRVSGIVAVM